MCSASPTFRASSIAAPGLQIVVFRLLPCLFVLATQCASFLIGAQTAQEQLARGNELVQADRFAEALIEFDRAKQHDPKDARPYIYSAKALLRAGRSEDAQNELQQAAQLAIEDPGVVLEYARALIGVGWLDRALEALSGLDASSRLEDEGLWLLADLYYRRRLADEARRTLEKYASRSPGDPRIVFRRGEIEFMAGDYLRAVKEFQAAVKAAPGDAGAQHMLGRAMWLADGAADCLQPLMKAVELDPDNPKLLHTLGLVCFKLGNNEGAIRYLKRSTALPGVSSEVFFDLGNAYRKAGEAAEARTALQRYQQIHSAEEAAGNRQRTVEQLLNQGLRQFDQGALADARKSLLRVVEIDPDHWRAHSFLAKAYLGLRQLPQARSHIERMLEIRPENAEGSFLMAFVLYLQRDPRGALPYARKSKELLPGNPELRNLLGNILLALGEREEALQEYEAAMRLAPNNFAFRSNYNALNKP